MCGSRRRQLHPIWWLPILLSVGFIGLTYFNATSPLLPSESRPTAPTVGVVVPTEPNQDSNQNTEVVEALRKEIAGLRQRIAARKNALTTALASAQVEATKRPSIETHYLSPDDWQNLGSGTPAHTLETMLYSAAAGDTKSLQILLFLDDETREFATALFEVVPADLKSEIGDVGQFVAMMTADAVPLKEYRIPGVFQGDDPLAAIVVLQTPRTASEENTPIVNLNARRESERSPWKIIVPTEAIERYHTKLLGPLSEEESAAPPEPNTPKSN